MNLERKFFFLKARNRLQIHVITTKVQMMREREEEKQFGKQDRRVGGLNV